MIILGIETSCDETGVAVIEDGKTVFSNVVATSLSLHAKTGGIIPEVAAREQVTSMLPVLEQALAEAKIVKEHIDAIAVTNGPGLIGSLLVGVETAKTLSLVWGKPLIPVNHLYGHIYANWLQQEKEITFPAISLVVSGGHTDLVLLKNHGELQVIGSTRDDAAGEAFDKIGRLLGLPYPAGPTISKLAHSGDSKVFPLPRPMIGSKDYEFSFSGLKTAVLDLLKKNPDLLANPQDRANLCASVQEAIVTVLVRKSITAAKEYNAKSFLLGGGVAANELLRNELQKACQENAIEFFVPEKQFCTDNAAMIAAAAFFNLHPIPYTEVKANPELYY
jgi:N6-L-threonylcarbamoyladenine synthase